MDSKMCMNLSINSCLQNGKQNTSLPENRDSSELTAILKGARQGIHNWKKEKTYFVVVTHLLPPTCRLKLCDWEGQSVLKKESSIQFNISLLVQRCSRYYCRAGLFASKCGLSMWISPCLTVSALSTSIGENGTIPLMTLSSNTITSIQPQNKPASSPLQVHTTT